MAHPSTELADLLRAEKALLVKADTDIEEGRQRLRNQENRVLELQADGHDVRQGERLAELLKETLTEWERHRALIEARIAYLEQRLALE
jgi:hypothetical protein